MNLLHCGWLRLPVLLQFVPRTWCLLRSKDRHDFWAWAVLLMVSLIPGQLDAQSDVRQISQPSSAVLEALRWLVVRSPIIFYGEVLPPESLASSCASSILICTVKIRVDHGLRGVSTGDVFSFGTWRSAEGLALIPHQRVILFVHRPNAAGVTSSVAGSFGLLQVGGGELIDVRSLALLGQEIEHPSDPSSPPNAPDEAHNSPFARAGGTTVPARQLIDTIGALVEYSHVGGTRAPAEDANAP